MRFRLLTADESVAEQGEGRCEVSGGTLVLSPLLGQPLRVRLADVAEIHDAGPGALTVLLTDGAMLHLDKLGRLHGQLLADLTDARGDDVARTLLLVGLGRPESFPGACDGAEAELRLYDDALVVLPRGGEPEQVPFAFVADVVTDATGYGVEVRTLDERTLRLGRLARRTTEFLDRLRSGVTAARGRTGYLVDAVLPGLGALGARSVAAALPDGLAAPRARLDAIDPTVFTALVSSCTIPDRRSCAALLAGAGELSFGWHQRTSVEQEAWSTFRGPAPAPPGPRDHGGARAAPGGLAGVLTGQMLEGVGNGFGGDPLLGALALGMVGRGVPGGPGGSGTLGHDHRPVSRVQIQKGQAGPAWTDFSRLQVGPEDGTVFAFLLCTTPTGHVVYEVLSEPDHASYVFRPGPGAMAVNRALALIGFRVEAIHAEADTAASTVRRAVERLPYLRVLRDGLCGRAIHGDSWERQIRGLLTA
jgi:hypothetical protein